jgi:tetratricopeptide (TPR) repeat protein
MGGRNAPLACVLAVLVAACASTARGPDGVAATSAQGTPATAGAAAPQAGTIGTGSGDPEEAALAAQSRLWPIDPTLYRTTSGEIYLENLDARVETLRARLQRSALVVDRERLGGALYHRYRLLGRLADAEAALALVDDPAAPVESADGLLLRSIVLAGFHRFGEAEAALAAAEAAGADATTLRRHRNDIAVALGRYDRLADDFAASAQPVADLYELAHRADLRVLLGDVAGAERQYWAAQTLYADVSPVPLAWLHTQAGIALLRFGRIEEARRFFVAAVERLPGYYLAEEHLAECDATLGATDAARDRYRRVIAQTGNPEFIAALAELEADAGNDDEAARLQRQARDGYEAWLARHRAAAAQHAAEFFLATGDAQRAHALASDNAALRADVGSLLLLAQTADAAGRDGEACEHLTTARATRLSPPEMGEVDGLAARCGLAVVATWQ